jgi:hypothetical protein
MRIMVAAMSKRWLGIAGLLLLAPLAIQAATTNGQRVTRYYVDYTSGSDANAGTSPDHPWKHAPGDPAAAGRAKAVKLAPGDHVTFVAGSIYRSEIHVTESGTQEAPIVFEGASGAAAVIDGSDPVSFVRCPSQAACGDLSNWRQLVLVSPGRPVTADSRLFADSGLLRPARAPNPADGFYIDEIDDMQAVPYRQIRSGTLPLPPSAREATVGEGARVALWVRPNKVIEKPITAISGGEFHFDPASVDFYTNRPSRYAVVGLGGTLDQPGEYVILPGGRQIVAMLPKGSRNLSIAEGRGGFELKGSSHVAIRNLTFRNMTDGGTLFDGIAILSNTLGSRGIEISGNRFFDMDHRQGQGPVTLRRASDLVISNNAIARIVGGSGIRLSGPGGNVMVRNNHIRRVGRTAIMLMDINDATIEGNFITDVRGVHGNGLSAYLDNHRVRFIHNTVLNAKQPATFRGRQGSNQVNDIEFIENLLVATPDALGSLIAWGGTTRGATIERNVLLGGRFGLRIPVENRNVSIVGNAGVKPAPFPGTAINWRMEGNDWFASAPPAWARKIIEAAATEAGSQRFDCREIPGMAAATRIGATITCRN